MPSKYFSVSFALAAKLEVYKMSSTLHTIQDAIKSNNRELLCQYAAENHEIVENTRRMMCSHLPGIEYIEHHGEWEPRDILTALYDQYFVVLVHKDTKLNRPFIQFKVSVENEESMSKLRRRCCQIHPLLHVGWVQYRLQEKKYRHIDPSPIRPRVMKFV